MAFLMHLAPSEIDFPQADHVLKALRLNREPGWSYPAHYLGMGFHSVSDGQAVLGMDVGNHIDAQGRPLSVILGVFADIALAASVRSRVGDDVRLATVSATLSFTGAAARAPLRGASTGGFLSQDSSTLIGNSTVSVTSGDAVICTGTANFAVLENRRGTAPHPMPGVRDFNEVQALSLQELTDAEEQLLARARQASSASAGPGGAPFLDHFWGLLPVRNEYGAQCEFPCGMHVGNRVGHTQGGILLGLAMNTSAAAPGPGWRVLDVAADFIRPGTGSRLYADARLLREGRNLAQVRCDISTEDGALVLSSLSTLLREQSPG